MPRLATLACIALLSCSPSAAADDVTIYRCTDAKGKLTLRDTPCAKGQQQQVRSMIRPKDAPPRARRESVALTATAPAPQRIVIRNAPRPLYECVRSDGSRYSSDTADGAPRYVPLWTLGYPVYPTFRSARQSGARIDINTDRVRVSGRSRSVFPPSYLPTYAASTFVRDECYALPQTEVCDRLDDRRDEIRRRFFNAMPSERAILTTEERGINARLADDCGTY